MQNVLHTLEISFFLCYNEFVINDYHIRAWTRAHFFCAFRRSLGGGIVKPDPLCGDIRKDNKGDERNAVLLQDD